LAGDRIEAELKAASHRGALGGVGEAGTAQDSAGIAQSRSRGTQNEEAAAADHAECEDRHSSDATIGKGPVLATDHVDVDADAGKDLLVLQVLEPPLRKKQGVVPTGRVEPVLDDEGERVVDGEACNGQYEHDDAAPEAADLAHGCAPILVR
jgi:hypothetical protein